MARPRVARRVILSGIAVAAVSLPLGVFSTTAVALTTVKAGRPPTTNFTTACNLGVLGNNMFSGSIQGLPPSSVSAASAFSVTRVRGDLVIPSKIANEAYALGVRSFTGRWSGVQLDSSGATPRVKSQFRNEPYQGNIVFNQPFTLPFPTSGSWREGWTAGPPGTDTIIVGSLAGKITFSNSQGVAIATVAFNCQPPSPPAVLAMISIA